VPDRLAVGKARRTQAHQVEQVVREAVARAGFVRHGEPVLLPCLIEQRQNAVMEDIEEIAQRAVLLGSQLLNDFLGVENRKHPEWSGESHEVHVELWRRVLGTAETLNLAGRKSGRRIYREAHGLFGRID